MKNKITNKIFNNKLDLISLLIIVIVSLIIRIYLVNSIPVNITGDESWDLSHIYRIVFNNISPLTLLGDGSVPAIVFYPVAYLIRIFGPDNSILFLRINIIIYSLLSLIAFYYILKQETSRIIAFSFTLLLSTNYVLLNFSRTAWVNMISVFTGLFTILFIQKAIDENKKIWYIVAGIFCGIGFYGYHYGRILALTVLFYLIFYLGINLKKDLIKDSFLFFLTAILISLPFFIKISSDQAESILRRPESIFVFSQNKLLETKSTVTEVLRHQLNYTLRGFILLDASVMNEGVENSRYVPLNASPVNIVIKTLFILGLIFFALKKKMSIWWFVIGSILITQVISVLPPNFSRGIFYIPVIYFICGVFVYNLILKISSRFRINKNFIYGLIIISSLFIFIHDVKLYFSWMKETYMENARQPAVSYEEFNKWQNYQIQLIKEGMRPTTNYQWKF